MTALTPAECGSLYVKIGFVEKLCKEAREALREKVRESGSLLIDETRELALVRSVRESVDVGAAWDVFTGEWGADHLAETIGPLLKIGKGDLSTLIGESAPKGKKGAHIANFFDRLREADAIRETPVEAMTIRKVVK
jgi:hypothetical protein